MARIDLDLAHAYRPHPSEDSDYALLPLTMSFRDGGAYALLGPSGCGKTTMLNIMSGLLVPSQGTVKFDGVDVTHATPQQRNIAQVFQFPVIYDTMTVAENLAFPLRNRKVPEDQIRKRVGEIAEMLDMSGQLNHRAAGDPAALPCTVTLVQDIGTHWMLTARIGEHTLKARLNPAAKAPRVGEEVWLQVMGPHTCLYINDELADA
jgi:ABC-type transporter Mla maintaining outer membrane lipid asymmetry ATPase subunit MlaF